jgi:hypothetical protein
MSAIPSTAAPARPHGAAPAVPAAPGIPAGARRATRGALLVLVALFVPGEAARIAAGLGAVDPPR